MQDRASRFVVAWATGALSEALIEQAVITTVQRTHQRDLKRLEAYRLRVHDGSVMMLALLCPYLRNAPEGTTIVSPNIWRVESV